MIRDLSILMLLVFALCAQAIAKPECASRSLPPVTNVKGLHVILRAKPSEHISDGIPLVLVVANSTPDDIPAQYEPLSETLDFDVFDSAGQCVSPLGVPLGGRSIFFHNRFPGGVEVDLHANLTAWVPITAPGTYVVIARFRPYLLNDHARGEFRTEPVTITVIR